MMAPSVVRKLDGIGDAMPAPCQRTDWEMPCRQHIAVCGPGQFCTPRRSVANSTRSLQFFAVPPGLLFARHLLHNTAHDYSL